MKRTVKPQLDLNWILANQKAVLDNLKLESLAVHQFLQSRFAQASDVSQDPVFQFVFRSFYRLDNAGLSDSFKTHYFEIMQEERSSPAEFDIAKVCRELYVHQRLKKDQSLQFSFVTKMANTLSPDFPVYDSEVARMHGFNPPYSVKEMEAKLDKLMTFYAQLQAGYKDMVESGVLDPLFKNFDAAFPAYRALNLVKKLDFIVWSAGKLKHGKRTLSAFI